MAFMSLSRACPRSRPLVRTFSRLPLPPSIPHSALRPLVAFSPSLAPPSTALHLPPTARSVPLAGTGLTAKVVQEGSSLEEGGRECWILANGSVVGWGYESDELRERASQLWQRQSGSGPVKGDEEQLDFFVDRSTQAPRLVGDIVALPAKLSHTAPSVETSSSSSSSPADFSELDLTQLLIRYAISEALSHSSQLNIVEAQLDLLVSRDVDVPLYLARHGRGPYSRKQVIQRLGQFLEVRQKISLRGLGDVPDLYWEEPLLEKYFKTTWKVLEIEKRVRTVNERIAHAQEVHGILKDLLTEQSTHNMEIIIILLIAVEVTLAFWTHWEELREAFGYPPSTRTTTAAPHPPSSDGEMAV